jgi:hypothetical protein
MGDMSQKSTKKRRLFGRKMSDTAFSLDRIFAWGVGIVMLIGMIGMVVIGYQGRPIPPQIQSATMFALGVFAARIEKRITE